MPNNALRHVRWLEQVTRRDLESVGAKAACLGELAAGGLAVPAGFVVPAEAFAAADTTAGAPLVLSAEVADEVRAAYQELVTRSRRGAVAVRSSGVLEDRDAASFAGIYRTFLNVSGADEVVRAVAECVRSSAEEGVDRYRQARGIEGGEARLSVLVQEMVAADVAGVAFTIDPLTGDASRIVIDSTFGLGAAVVSGAVIPDHFVLARETGELLDVRLAFKDRQMRAVKEGQGTETIRISHQKANAPSLTGDELKELCRVALAAERLMGAPQDVEWARARGQFLLLQSRPVTTRPREAAAEEVLTRSADQHSTTALIDELAPVPLTRFAASFAETVAARALDTVAARRGVPVMPSSATLGQGAPSWSAAPLEAMARALPSPFDRGLDARIRSVGRPANPFERWGLSSHLRSKAKVVGDLAVRVESFFWWQSMADIEGISARAATASLKDFQERLSGVLAQRVDSLFHASCVAGLLEARLDTIPSLSDAERADSWLGVRDNTMPRLMGRLVEIAHLGAEAPKLAAILRGEAMEVLPRLEREWASSGRRMRSAVKEVLRDYGHWSAVDLDVSAPSWREDPTPLIALMGRYLELEPHALPTARMARAVERGQLARRRTLDGVAAWRRFALTRLFARYAQAVRELIEVQDHLSRVTDRARVYVSALGGRLAADGKLAAVSEIHWLSFEDVAKLAESDSPDASRRRGMVAPLAPTSAADARSLPRRGKGLSPGRSQGPLRRVVTPADLKRLGPGEIAWTPCPGRVWFPYLPLLAGLVVDAGAPLALGVLGARELDVPAVVGAGAPPASLGEGTLVAIDGLTGEVSLASAESGATRAAS